jgi:hypothetical protein
VPFIEKGANVKRGEINIRCPFCGSADPSFHMGISEETGWYSCWRNRSQHSGKSPLRLLMKLLRVPYGRAREIAGLGDDYVDPEGFDAMAARVMGRDKATGRREEVRRRTLDLDPSFRPIGPHGRTGPHWDYLLGRGFADGDIEALGRLYGVCAGGGSFAGRVVLPYYQDGHLVTWTARAIGRSSARYLDLSRDESILAPKETLYNHDAILEGPAVGGGVLVMNEGPFDALKLDFYGRAFGVRAVAFSTNSVTEAQAYLLQGAIGVFARLVVMLDQNASGLGVVDSMRMKQALSFLPDLGVVEVPYGAKDGAELTRAEVAAFAQSLNH